MRIHSSNFFSSYLGVLGGSAVAFPDSPIAATIKQCPIRLTQARLPLP